MASPRKYLSTKGLLSSIRNHFEKVPTIPQAARNNPITLVDCLMSGLAIFGMKCQSLLQFEEQVNNSAVIKSNLQTLYQVEQVPCDTYMRERLDEALPFYVRSIYKKLFALVQRGKALEPFCYFDNHYLMPMDMTGFFSSSKVHCENCCVKKHDKVKVKLIDKIPESAKGFREKNYLFCNVPNQPWQLFYIQSKQVCRIDIASIPELFSYLADKNPGQLLSTDVDIITEMLSCYHAEQHTDSISYYHNMMCAAIVHPDKKFALPFAPEPVMKSDGAAKNDCERNAAKRLIADIRREHPHLKLIAVQDAIASNYPNLKQLNDANMRYIVGVKPGDHKALFTLVNSTPCHEYQHTTPDEKTHHYRYQNEVALNDSHPDFKVNFFEYWETDKKGKTQHFSWVTDILITDKNLYDLMRGGRSNWKIENNTFNTLKNQGYHFSHNFGHGYKHLCTIFGMLMMLAFFVDQIQELCCPLFQKARAKYRSRTTLWDEMRSLFQKYFINSWDDLWNGIGYGHAAPILTPDTS